MDTQEIVSRVVRVYMAARDETHEELAAAIGLSRPATTQKLGNRTKWTLADLEKLRAHYGLTVEELLTGSVLRKLGVELQADAGRGLHGRRGPRREVRRAG